MKSEYNQQYVSKIGNSLSDQLYENHPVRDYVPQPNASEFVELGKFVAPRLPDLTDRKLVEQFFSGRESDRNSVRGIVSEAEIILRLVELRLGPLGRIRPIRPDAAQSEDRRRRKEGLSPLETDRQAPVLGLAAGVLGDAMQRLGDRLFVKGKETSLPDIVRLARKQGARIRYPGLDPMDAVWAGGPSRRDGGEIRIDYDRGDRP